MKHDPISQANQSIATGKALMQRSKQLIESARGQLQNSQECARRHVASNAQIRRLMAEYKMAASR